MRLRLPSVIVMICLFAYGCVGSNEYSLPQAVSVSIDSTPFIVSAPKGFCVDQTSAKKTRNIMTVFIVNCVDLGNSWNQSLGRRPISALLSATVAVRDDKGDIVKELYNFFSNKKGGSRYLSASQELETKLLRSELVDGMLFLYLEKNSENAIYGQKPRFARLFFVFDNKLVSLHIANFSNQYNSLKPIRRLAIDFAFGIRAANEKATLVQKFEKEKK